MSAPRPDVIEFLKTRRSRPAKTLTSPGPNRSELMVLLEIASRTPDHGKLEPWRFIVLGPEAMPRMADTTERIAQSLGWDAEKTAKARSQFDQGISAVIVVETQIPSEKVPTLEQTYAVGGVCLALLNAALASGWGANWLTGAISHERRFVADALGLTENERIAGLIHIGTETTTPPERPRPDVEAKTTWL